MKHRCDNCGRGFYDKELLEAPNPFEPELKIYGCPFCKSVNELTMLCDEDGCEKDASCGFPTPSGYKVTCGDHFKPE